MSNDVVKLFETITGIKFDVMLENVRNSYEWTLMSEKKLRAKKRYLRRYYRHAPNKACSGRAVQLSKEAVANPISLSMRSFPFTARR